jgi:hypothetical protein
MGLQISLKNSLVKRKVSEDKLAKCKEALAVNEAFRATNTVSFKTNFLIAFYLKTGLAEIETDGRLPDSGLRRSVRLNNGRG